MNKVNLFIDADDTILRSNESLRMLYSDTFKTAMPDELVEWDGGDKLPLAPKGWVEDVFSGDEIWRYMRMFDGFEESISYLKDTGLFNLSICTICSPQNAVRKLDYFDKHGFGKYFDDFIMVTKPNKGFTMGKDFLRDGLLIDDHIKNLQTIKMPILFTTGQPKRWNDGWKGSSINGWNQDSLRTIMDIAIKEINSK